MDISLFLVYLFVFKHLVHVEALGFQSQDYKLPIKDLIEKYGYPFEEHQLVTEDDYILITHRIPHGRWSNKTNSKPLLFVHGLSGSSENILSLGPGNGLGFLLVDNGYDVWLMNTRGSFYSRSHKKINPDSPKYWQFSWDEIGTIDIPLNIDYILNHTQQNQLYYLGHSQGSTSYFVMTSNKPEYNKKIKVHISLAPPIFMNYNVNEVGFVLSKHIRKLQQIIQNFNAVKMVSPLVHKILQKLCLEYKSINICLNLLYFIGGTKSRLIKKEIVPYVLRSSPFGVSIFQFLHYLQVTKSGIFRKYDFGINENLRRYKSKSPPAYDLIKSRAPVVLVYSENDWFSSGKQTQHLSYYLPNVVHMFKIPIANFSHLDFVFAHNARKVLYDHLIEFLHFFPFS